MNILILDPEERLSSGEFKVNRSEAFDHIQNILHKKKGDSVKAAVTGESLGLFRILSVDANQKEIVGRFTSILRPKPRTPSLHLLVAVQRPPTVEKIIQLAGTWGAYSIEFLLADLSRREYLTSPVWRKDSLERNLLLGMEQGGNIYKPAIELGFTLPGTKLSFTKKESMKERVEALSSFAFYLEKKGDFLFRDRGPFSSGDKAVTVLLGPEAGWTKSELGVFEKRGLKPVRLSQSILRSEQALAFFLAQWEMTHSKTDFV